MKLPNQHETERRTDAPPSSVQQGAACIAVEELPFQGRVRR
ncbi:MAG: hypothetical protein ACRD3B_05175 [Candidatus Sulfotelmatobacter sp.]